MKKILFSGLAVLFCISLQAQNSVNLRLNPEKNKIYRFRSTSEQNVTQTVNGVQQTTESAVSYSMLLKMLEITPDFLIAEVRMDTMITVTNTMGKVVRISSETEGDIKATEMADVLSCIYNRLSRNALYAKIDYTGKPVEIVNAGMLAEIILRDTGDIAVAGPAGDAVKKQAADMISADQLKNMIGMFTNNLPGREVSSGDTWSTSQQMNSGGMMLEIGTTYRLDGLEGGYASVTSESVIKPSANAVPIESGGATVTYGDMKGFSKSVLKIEISTGLLAEDSGKTRLSGNLGISAPGFSMQMPMEINGETKVTRVQ